MATDTAKPARKPKAPAAATKPASKAAKAAPKAAKAAKPAPRIEAKARFSRALDEARAGAIALRDEALGHSEQYSTKLSKKSEALRVEAKARGDDLKARAVGLAQDGKARTSGAVSSLGRMVAGNASTIDESLGAPYGDYARKAASQIDTLAARIDAKDLGELGDDAREFVTRSPGLALGIAVAAGFMLSRLFRSSED